MATTTATAATATATMAVCVYARRMAFKYLPNQCMSIEEQTDQRQQQQQLTLRTIVTSIETHTSTPHYS